MLSGVCLLYSNDSLKISHISRAECHIMNLQRIIYGGKLGFISLFTTTDRKPGKKQHIHIIPAISFACVEYQWTLKKLEPRTVEWFRKEITVSVRLCAGACVYLSSQCSNALPHVDTLQIQEEMEMWKMRGWEIEMSHHKHLSDGDSVR